MEARVVAVRHLRCWGTGYRGELGTTGAISQTTPGIVGIDSDGWVDVEMNLQHACARRNDGSVWCWGENDDLQLANANLPSSDPVPTVVPGGPASWLAMATGQFHFCGIGDDHAHPSPQAIPGAWTAISAGASHTCGIQSGGSLWCWGANEDGQLGDGNGWRVTPVKW